MRILPDKSDEEIASQVQGGNTDAFGVLVERYEAKMSRYAKKFISNSEDIADLVQTVFVKAYVNIQGFNVKRKFSSWLYRIAHNEFVNALKKKSRRPLSLFDFDTLFPHLPAKETADFKTNEREIKEMLNRCLNELHPKYREALVLYYFEQMSYREIAEILRIPVSTVGVRLSRGKIILKKIFDEKYPQHHD